MNRRHRAAQLAQRASTQLYTTLYFKERARKLLKDQEANNMDVDGSSGANVDEDVLNERAAEEVDAFVMSIESDSLIVLIPRFGLEGRLTLPTSNGAKEVRVNYEQGAGYVQILRQNSEDEVLRIACFQTIRCKVCLVSSSSSQGKKSDGAASSNDRSPLKIFFIPPANYFA